MDQRNRFDRMQELFAGALELPPAEREAWLRAAADRTEVAEVLALLRAHDMSGRLDRVADKLGAFEATDPDPALTLPAPARVGPYALLRPIAHGGMGSVYLAERADGQVRYQVAVKLLRRDLDSDEARRRFFAERQILARITHPNIARLLDAGITDEGRPYFVMEHVEGEPIDQHCDGRHATVNQRLELFRTVGTAVQHAHRCLVVHRDLKPANILVAADGTVKLLDFGIAKALDPDAFPESGRTETGLRLMTPEYASPEQLRGEPVTTASDVYQLGLLLYVLLTGRRPRLRGEAGLPGGATREVTRPSVAVAGRPAPAEPDDSLAADPAWVAATRGTTPERLRRQLAGDLDNIVLRALREEPDRRYASVEQLAEDVRRHLVGLPVTARPETLRYVAAKFIRRHRGGVATAATIAVLLIASAVGMTVQARRVTRERDRARQVSGLLVEMFRSASPEDGGGDTVTVVQVLERGIEQVRTALTGQPDLQANMLVTLAEVYRGLGQHTQGLALAREALPLSLASRPADHPETLWNLMTLADLLGSAGQADSAIGYAERAVALGRRRFGDDSEELGRFLASYGLLLQLKGDLIGARRSFTESIAILRRHEGSRYQLASSLANLAWIDENEGDLTSAEAGMREALAIRRASYPAGHPFVARAIGALADILLAADRVGEAETLIVEAAGLAERTLPPTHPTRAAIAALHAEILDRAGKANDADRRYREALAAHRAAFGDRTLGVAQTLNDYALFLHERRGDARSAEPLFRESAAIFAELRGPSDPWTASVQGTLAETLLAQGRVAEADSLLKIAIATLETRLGTDHARLAMPLLNQGLVYMFRGNPTEAEPHLRRAFTIARGSHAGELRVALTQSALGSCLVARGLLGEAEPLLLAAHQTFTRRRVGGPYPPWTVNALVQLYTRSGRPEEAARYRTEPTGR